MRTNVVPGGLPLLLSCRTLQSIGAVISYVDHTLEHQPSLPRSTKCGLVLYHAKATIPEGSGGN